MGARDGTDEVCPRDVLILWSQRAATGKYEPVPVRYGCGCVHPCRMDTLDRFRKGHIGQCEVCKVTHAPLPEDRPLCAQCGLNLAAKRYRGGEHVGYTRLCWSCGCPNAKRRMS